MVSATILASSSGRRISNDIDLHFLLGDLLQLFLHLVHFTTTFTDDDTGREVCMVMVILFRVRSITTRAMPPLEIRASRYLRIFSSSMSFSAPFFPPNQLESHPRMIPNLLPIGFIFCPIQILFSLLSFCCSFLEATTMVIWLVRLRIRYARP